MPTPPTKYYCTYALKEILRLIYAEIVDIFLCSITILSYTQYITVTNDCRFHLRWYELRIEFGKLTYSFIIPNYIFRMIL